MKFGALLRNSAQEVPELQSLFVCYKHLKKRLKRLPMREARTGAAVESNSYVIENERAFVALLISDIQAFNENFVEREEQCVIQLSLLEEKALAAQEADEVASVYKSFVDYHGQTLMLVHWSILAYTSVLKILKKHHKRTGLQVQEFNMQQLLSQPFCSVELISGLVRKAEEKAQELAGQLNPGTAQASLSAASPASSPVAELISAARKEVQEIADSAAQGNEALDEHLREQPSEEVGSTSSDEASAEGGEAEVVSVLLQDVTQSTERRTEAASHGCSGAAQSGSMLKRQMEASRSGRPAKQGKLADGSKRCAEGNCTARRLVRTVSMAGDSEAPIACPATSTRGHEASARKMHGMSGASHQEPNPAADDDSQQPAAPGGNAEGPRASEHLTVGQGYGQSRSRNILRQTQMALGLWEQLHYMASTPSTVVPPLKDTKEARGSANSAA